MANEDSVLYGFRLNINNPDHLKIHRILRDLDISIYKSKSNFIIGILKNYLLEGGKDVPLSDTEVAEQGGYVTKEYVDNMKDEIRKSLEKEIRQELFDMVLAATAGVGRTVMVEKSQTYEIKDDTDKDDEENEKLMQELTSRWS